MEGLLAYNLLKLSYLFILLGQAILGIGLQALGARLDEVVHPLLDIGLFQIICPAEIHQTNLALDDIQNRLRLPLSCPTLIF